jgi:hypothetical protein
MNNLAYEKILEFKKRNRGTIGWRSKAHAKVIDKHINPGEELLYVFTAQKGVSSLEIFNTYAVAITNKRILLAQKRVLWGYTLVSITPDMFNDLTVSSGLIWAKIVLDTVKEIVVLSNISKSAADEIETVVTETMMREKKKYVKIAKEEN